MYCMQTARAQQSNKGLSYTQKDKIFFPLNAGVNLMVFPYYYHKHHLYYIMLYNMSKIDEIKKTASRP